MCNKVTVAEGRLWTNADRPTVVTPDFSTNLAPLDRSVSQSIGRLVGWSNHLYKRQYYPGWRKMCAHQEYLPSQHTKNTCQATFSESIRQLANQLCTMLLLLKIDQNSGLLYVRLGRAVLWHQPASSCILCLCYGNSHEYS